MEQTNRRDFLTAVSAVGFTAIAGCSSSSEGDDGSNGASNLSITNNDIGSRGTVTTSTVTVQNTGSEGASPTISVEVGIGPDAIYGQYSDEQTTSIGAGETVDVTLDLFDGNDLSEVAYQEVQSGFFAFTYYINGTEKSYQEFGDEDSTYLSFKVLYDGAWQGALGTESGQRSISGRGDAHLPVDNAASIVSGNAQKQDDSSSTLTVQILVNGDVVTEQSTSAAYGIAQISENI